MKRSMTIIALISSFILLASCGKVVEKASEKLVEKAIESQSKDGEKTRVNVSDGTAKVTTTDASGKSSTMEWGGAQVSESDLGVPFYPGTKPRDGASSRMVTPQATVVTVSLHSSDTADKVTSFYREKLKSLSQGKQLMDMSMGEGNTSLMLADEKAKSTLQINVMKADSGSDINIVVSREVAK